MYSFLLYYWLWLPVFHPSSCSVQFYQWCSPIQSAVHLRKVMKILTGMFRMCDFFSHRPHLIIRRGFFGITGWPSPCLVVNGPSPCPRARRGWGWRVSKMVTSTHVQFSSWKGGLRGWVERVVWEGGLRGWIERGCWEGCEGGLRDMIGYDTWSGLQGVSKDELLHCGFRS